MRSVVNVIWVIALMLVSLPAPEARALQSDRADRAAEAAIRLSTYEAQGFSGELYLDLHLDAKVLIPARAVHGWYADSFFPAGPGVITVIGVEFVDWTWGVTGVTYADTAEVTYTQPFANGEVVQDIVRLVEDNGAWRWFFGRTLEFVNSQIALYAPAYPQLTAADVAASSISVGGAPWGIDRYAAFVQSDGDFRSSLPLYIAEYELAKTRFESGAEANFPSEIQSALTVQYVRPPESIIPAGETRLFTLSAGVDPADALISLMDASRQSPHFELLRQSLTGPILFVFVEVFANEAVGNVPIFLWASADSPYLFSASMMDYAALRLLVTTMTAGV